MAHESNSINNLSCSVEVECLNNHAFRQCRDKAACMIRALKKYAENSQVLPAVCAVQLIRRELFYSKGLLKQPGLSHNIIKKILPFLFPSHDSYLNGRPSSSTSSASGCGLCAGVNQGSAASCGAKPPSCFCRSAAFFLT
jgi:hypothetical protein